MAKITNFVTYPNAVPASDALIDEAVKANTSLFPTPEVRANLFTVTPVRPEGAAQSDARLDQAGHGQLSQRRRRGR